MSGDACDVVQSVGDGVDALVDLPVVGLHPPQPRLRVLVQLLLLLAPAPPPRAQAGRLHRAQVGAGHVPELLAAAARCRSPPAGALGSALLVPAADTARRQRNRRSSEDVNTSHVSIGRRFSAE